MPLEQGLHFFEVDCLFNVVYQPMLKAIKIIMGFKL
jgi:hypothetical protein